MGPACLGLCHAGHPFSALTPTWLSLPPQVDTTLFAEFQAWRESPTLDKTSPFLERVYREDVGPCLDFTMQEVRRAEGGLLEGLAPWLEASPSSPPSASLLRRSSRP